MSIKQPAMKKFLLIIAAAVLFASCAAEPAFEQTEEVGPFTVKLIEKNVWHVEDCNSSNPHGFGVRPDGTTGFNACSDMYIIRGKKKALLIDLSNNVRWAEGADEALRSIFYSRAGDREKLITITHNHGDHTGMLHAFIENKDIRYALPEKDFNRLVERFPGIDYSFINEGHVFDLGDIEVKTIEVPGHTDGSMVFSITGRDILLTGDAIGSGHGVWIFNTEAFNNYAAAVPHLISWIEDPANSVNAEQLRIYGGLYWQRDWFPELEGKEMGMSYLNEMLDLVNEIKAGTAGTEPSGLDHPVLDTYFRHGMAIVVWNAEQAQQL